VGADVLAPVLKLEVNDFYRIIAETLLVNPEQPLMALSRSSATHVPKFGIADARGWLNLNNYENEPFLNDCKVTAAFGPNSKNGSIENCGTVWKRAKILGNGFKSAKLAKNDEARLSALVQVVKKLGVNPLANLVVAKAYAKATGQQAPIGYYVRIEPGPGVNPYSNSNSQNLSKMAFRRNQLVEGVLNVAPSESRIKDGSVYVANDTAGDGSGQYYLSITSSLKLKPDQRITMWLQEFKTLLRDIPNAAAVAENVVAQEVMSDSVESLYRYEIAIPKELVAAARGLEKSELHVRIENSRGEPLSEFGRFTIRSKRLE
jgi:hypothetical protein